MFKTYNVLRSFFLHGILVAILLGSQSGAGQPQRGMLAGYLLVPHNRVPESYNAGFSMYVAAWPLVREYPGNRFQTGLFGTWMHAWYEQKPERKLYSDIEGGLGWWRDTQFATETPKFIMGGVALNFCAWANGPGAGKGRDWSQPKGKYGIVQLSPWVLWPPDGLNLKQGTCGQLFGYGYLPLPLTEPKKITAGKPVSTGNQCWTLFLNTATFKGPVAFFSPYFWSRPSVEDPELAGMFLDSRPSQANRAIQMETQYVPAAQSVDKNGKIYARVASMSFPRNSDGVSPVIHRVTSYNRKALWDKVDAWFQGGPAADGRIDPAGAAVQTFPGHGHATWKIYTSDMAKEDRPPLDWTQYAQPIAIDELTYGIKWKEPLTGEYRSVDGSLTALPEYYHLVEKNNKRRWIAVSPDDVPAETHLAEFKFERPAARPAEGYVTPEQAESCWKKPGPVAGPFYAYPGDGSVVTYYWYRFADQPALLNADLNEQERQNLQKRAEMIHRRWTKDRDYLAPPTIGQLAEIDAALIVSPPPGLEIGYVPIAVKQSARK